jgi:hypothetical protein
MSENNGNQMALFAYSGETDTLAAGISRFQTVEKRAGGLVDGELLGVAMTIGKRRDLTKSIKLEGKTNVAKLDKAILEMTDDALKGIKAELAALDSQDYTAHNTPISVRRMKDGRVVRTYKVVSVERDDRVDTAELAKALGVDESVIIKMREAKLKADAEEAKNTVEVASEVSDATPEVAVKTGDLTVEQERALAEAILAQEQAWTDAQLSDDEKQLERDVMREEAVAAAKAPVAEPAIA